MRLYRPELIADLAKNVTDRHERANPRSKDFHWTHYKKLLEVAGLPDIRWHDLRSTYCTLLLKSDFNPKAVSKLMGTLRS